MLQQTTVTTVLPYYDRFMTRFPNVKSLADASEEEVLSLWSGLGYYSRARNLHKAAKLLKNSKAFPHTLEALLQLPGIGRYTAGAIASIAFELRVPILDGNVMRVLSRLFLMDEDPKSGSGQKVFWQKAEDILPHKQLGDFNQALMELGATVCAPEKPICLFCPLQKDCRAFQEADPEKYPKILKKISYKKEEWSVAVIRRGNKLLMRQRKNESVMKGMWEFPMVLGNQENLQNSFPIILEKPLKPIAHSIMNRRLQMTPYLCALKEKALASSDYRWVSLEDFDTLPMSSMIKKMVKKNSF